MGLEVFKEPYLKTYIVIQFMQGEVTRKKTNASKIYRASFRSVRQKGQGQKNSNPKPSKKHRW